MTALTLADFLLARIAEDEAAAEAVASLAHNFDMGGNRQEERFTHGRAQPSSLDGIIQHTHDPATSQHFSRWEPARVLAECEAKRQIVEEHAPVDYGPLGMRSPNACHICGIDAGMFDWEYARDSFPCATLRALALPYAAHPDYREEWRP